MSSSGSNQFLEKIGEILSPIKNFYDNLKNIFDHHLPIDIPPIIIPFPLFPYLQLRIIPFVVFQTHLGLEYQIKNTHLGFDDLIFMLKKK